MKPSSANHLQTAIACDRFFTLKKTSHEKKTNNVYGNTVYWLHCRLR
jgi:hypothetical protein